MLGFYLAIIIFTFIFILKNTIRSNTAHVEKSNKSFWSRESEANSVRAQDISNLDYVNIPISSLPLSDNDDLEISRVINNIKALSNKKIINLSSYSNTDLKLMYGPANLTNLSEYDDNYTTLIRLLYKLGDLYYNHNNINDSLAILEYGILIGTNISSHFVLLATIYQSQNKIERINDLIDIVNNTVSLNQQSLLNNLNNIKSSI